MEGLATVEAEAEQTQVDEAKNSTQSETSVELVADTDVEQQCQNPDVVAVPVKVEQQPDEKQKNDDNDTQTKPPAVDQNLTPTAGDSNTQVSPSIPNQSFHTSQKGVFCVCFLSTCTSQTQNTILNILFVYSPAFTLQTLIKFNRI